ncbi:uncharacterized protein LOC122309937 [Carya illinoinensis]|uniref:uncharacterized protein LOC122309937 n=1 Tax=Carya illinoinensis TaxID=32201 RepID=UPI001C719C65|nr:uncharacterized protein LOC122309937 [Carya illinoinensis]
MTLRLSGRPKYAIVLARCSHLTACRFLWSCPAATDVWGEATSPVRKWHIAYEDFSVLWRDLSTRLEAEQLDQIAVVLYQLWKRRNRWVFDNKFQSPSIIYKNATDELEVFKQVGLLQKQQVADTGMQNQERVRVLWEPAGANCYKFNFDAAFDKNNNTMGIGGVLRDSRGEAEIMLSAPRAHVPSVFHAECYALIRVMELCHDLRISNVIFEGDAKQVIDSINGQHVDCSWKGQLIEDIQFLLARQTTWRVRFVKREANHVAHAAAKYAKFLISEAVWMEEGPSEIMSFVLSDKECIPF